MRTHSGGRQDRFVLVWCGRNNDNVLRGNVITQSGCVWHDMRTRKNTESVWSTRRCPSGHGGDGQGKDHVSPLPCYCGGCSSWAVDSDMGLMPQISGSGPVQ